MWGAALAAAVALLLVALALPSAAQAGTFYGITANRDVVQPDFNLMKKAHVETARVLLPWANIEPNDDQFNWAQVDREVGGFASNGVQPVGYFFGTPFWVGPTSNRPPVDSARQKSEWKEFVGEAVERYGRGGTYWKGTYQAQFPGGKKPKPVKAWQPWNEPNGPKHVGRKPNPKPDAKLYKITRQAINKEDRRADIVLPGLAAKPTGKGGIKAWTYISKLLKIKGAKKSFDHVALHPYAPNVGDIKEDIRLIRRALKKGGKKKAQVWLTEVGWSSDRTVKGKLGKSPKQQASLLKKTYTLLKKKRKAWKIGGVYWYTWRDFAAGICDWCPTAGLVDQSRDPKPSYRAYKKVAR